MMMIANCCSNQLKILHISSGNKNENEWCRGRIRIGQMVIGRFGQWPSVSSASCYYYGGV
ncbi:hypothetical protein T4B_13874 [Trichinella pseudospiralis]|uniref:Uncharacterized protein n=1 Tax=Trichinella pseudospiralis TaxID=6337 RepID=A0A0V1J8Z6_TRIPS|nr:hypothetical protein T4A_3447 [Trichinella pseudospiralis]KRZ24273.1 hypothetical protein T4B_13874 [Trichinella pseudospiralis]KRZ31447.1 hypothetical protein T4C_5785 [Trichinella pseudospiralis]